MQSIESTETYAYGTSKDLVSEKEDIKCSNIIKRYNFDDITIENIKERNPNWPQITDHPYKIGGSRSGKTNSLFNLINQQPDINKIYLFKDLYEVLILILISIFN